MLFATKKEVVSLTRSLYEFGLSFSIGTLGFLIAGITIFAASSNTSMFKAMGTVKYSESDFSYLRHIFYIFMNVFIHFIVFASMCFAAKFAWGEGGIIEKIITIHPELWMTIEYSFLLALLSSYTSYVLFLLQAFIFNIYKVIFMSIRWSVESD